MLDIIVTETNRKIEETMVQLQSMLTADSSCRYGYIPLTDLSEILAVIEMFTCEAFKDKRIKILMRCSVKYLAIQF